MLRRGGCSAAEDGAAARRHAERITLLAPTREQVRATQLQLIGLPRGQPQPCEALGTARSMERRVGVRWGLSIILTRARRAIQGGLAL